MNTRRISGSRKSAAVLARAEQLCRQNNLRFTPMRRRVLQELSRSAEPLTAYDLADLVREEKRIAPVTVYRALDFLLECKLIHRIAIRNAFMACDHAPHQDQPPVFLVCVRCRQVSELPSNKIEHDLQDAIAGVGFKPMSRVLEVEGECAVCQASK
jgi:Fur family transcriptional regulator, zinc uptake regulator